MLLSEMVVRSQLSDEYQEKTHIIVKKELDSTNIYLKQKMLDPSQRAVCLVEKQTATHGRFQRPYFAKKGKGIYFSMSFYLPPQTSEVPIPNITIVAAVAVIEIFQELIPGKPFCLKWVNDVYIGEKKVCGILAESTLDPICHQMKVVVGIGINHSIDTDDFPEELRQKATSLFLSNEKIVDRSVIVGKIVQRFFEILEREDMDYLKTYRKYSFILGRRVTYVQHGKVYSGEAKEILDDGALLVRLNDGTEQQLHSGEISLSTY